jgi:putative tricarboxylic transport membrane protein
MMEQNLRRALSISDGHLGILFQSPVTWVLWVLAAAALAMPLVLRKIKPAG